MTIDVQGAPADRHLRAVHATVGQASTRRLRVPLLAAAWWWLLSVSVAASTLYGDEVRVAAAANFSAAAREIGELFADATGHKALLSFGSSGQLYAQITQGAPFDVFLAADRGYPRRAVQDGHAVTGSVFTYATGRLVLFSVDPGRVTGSASLAEGTFTRLAIANPELAPYGAAAVEVLEALGLADRLQPTLVRGNNVAQTYQFVITGNAELGFVALAQVIGHEHGSRWIVPRELHSPIAQDAGLLARASASEAAAAFLAFLRGPEAAAVLARYGYE
ncbi:MAG: molybdate ABC transporter substrate-binding protein [Spirochaetaceae bacterium]|nr:molybdate ABC transporter substrate-binding protein [Spirochaetaceae bacterium]